MRASATNAARAAGIDQPELATAGVSIVPMPRVLHAALGNHVQAITLGRMILVAPSAYERVVNGDAAELLVHELIHAGQWADEGVVRFLARYVGDYVRLRAIGLDHTDAYRNIGYEYAAYAGAARIVAES